MGGYQDGGDAHKDEHLQDRCMVSEFGYGWMQEQQQVFEQDQQRKNTQYLDDPGMYANVAQQEGKQEEPRDKYPDEQVLQLLFAFLGCDPVAFGDLELTEVFVTRQQLDLYGSFPCC